MASIDRLIKESNGEKKESPQDSAQKPSTSPVQAVAVASALEDSKSAASRAEAKTTAPDRREAKGGPARDSKDE